MLTTTTLCELVLATTAMAGLGVSVGSLWGSIARRRAFERDGLNGLRMLHATSNVWRDSLRLVSATVLLVAAGILLCLPPSTEPAVLVSKGALVLVGWCLLGNTLSDAVTRRRVTHAIEVIESKEVSQ